MFAQAKRFYHSPFLLSWLVFRAFNSWRLQSLRWQARLHGARLVMGKCVFIGQATRFQGAGSVAIGARVSLGHPIAGSRSCSILLQPRHKETTITIGSGTEISNGVLIMCRTRIDIGSNCLIGFESLVMDSDFHGIAPDQRRERGLSSAVQIGDNVWLGARTIVLKGVHIGQDAVVGAGCVVSRSVAAGSIVVGNPMKVVGSVYA